MKFTLFILFILSFLVQINFSFSQKIDSSYYRSPIDFPISLSGNFGELRSNHFHSGIDIRTKGEEGKVVYAVADGFVSRIKVSAYGYGNALYITHPNGQVSVYGHLQQYNKKITEYIRTQQYNVESFEVDLFPQKNILKVNKGDTVALSGNTGGSEAPHLHFEIRDDKTEQIKNPLLNGFFVPDSIKPTITELVLYPKNIHAAVNNENERINYDVKNVRGNLSLVNNKPIEVSGIVGFAIETNDEENDHAGKNGTYNIQLYVDNELRYEYKIAAFAFEQTRNINAHIDYQLKKKSGKLIQKCFVEPNNKFPCYKFDKNRGFVNFTDDSIHLVKIVVSDVSSNQNTLLFLVQSHKNIAKEKDKNKGQTQDYFYHNIDNYFSRDGIKINIPNSVLQNDISFEYKMEVSHKNYSPIYKIHHEEEGLLAAYSLKIKPTKSISDKLKSKLLIASVNHGGGLSAEGGSYNTTTNTVDANLKNFGYFTVAIDTVKPFVGNIIIDKPSAKIRNIIVKISDNFSGIKSYKGTVDGKWILMEYDYKNARLIYTFDEKYNDELPHKFAIIVTDQKGNEAKAVKEF